MIDKLYTGFSGIKTGICLIMLCIYLAGIQLAGGNIVQFFVFAICCIICILIPGHAVNKNKAMGSLSFVYGMAMLCVIFIAAKLAGLNNFQPLFGFYAGFSLVYLYKNKNELKIRKTAQLRFFILLYAFVMLIYTFLAVAKHAHPSQAGQLLLSQDFMWTVGNRESIKTAFPPTDIRFSGVTLKYHYFTELMAAAISSLTNISCYNILGFYMQSFMLAFFLCAVYDLGMVYYNSEIKTNLFALSFFTLSCLSLWKVLPNGASVFNYSMLETVISNVNSQCTGLAFTSVFVMLILKIIRGENGFNNIFSAVLAFVLLIFSKSPIAAILVLALARAAFVNLFTENEKRITTAICILCFGLFGIIYTGFLSAGAGKSALFNLTKTLELGYFKNFLNLFYHKNIYVYKISIPVFMVISFVCMMPFQSVVVIPRMLKDSLGLFRLSFEKLWFYACICGGALAFFVTYHEAFSQVYFIYVAVFFMNLMAVKYFDFSKINLKNIIPYGFAVLSCITTLCFYINFGGSGIRQYLFHYDILEKYPYRYCVKAEDELAGIYLRENMQDGELFITNRTHTGAGEGLSNVYTCFSGKQSFMEGFKYTVSNMGIGYETYRPRVEFVGKVFGIYEQDSASRREIEKMCKTENIRYAVFSTQFEGVTHNLEAFPEVFSNGTVTVYKLY